MRAAALSADLVLWREVQLSERPKKPGPASKVPPPRSRRRAHLAITAASVTLPVPIEVRSKASFRVQVGVAGTEFTTAVEGQTIDRWSDARLETGGIGFLAEPDDRSRLYWVKLSSSGQPS
jgi:hypothetical protein